jgi:twitching motility two-component system response regulator PilH
LFGFTFPIMSIKTVLIVDDSAVERYHLGALLRGKGYTVLEAVDGQEALSKAKLSPPDLVLMDVVMPGASGFQITRQISKDEVLSLVPVIMCTGKDSETDKVWGMRQGAKGYLIKPIQADLLFKAIADLDKMSAEKAPV